MDEDTDSPFLSSQGSTLSSSGSSYLPESFLFETKYVILHFLGILPADLYMGHLSSSATSIASNNSPSLFKSNGRATGVRSLPPSPPKLKTIGQLKSDDLSSPASDTNVQYQYSVNKNVENHVPELTSSPDCIADKIEYVPSQKYLRGTPSDQERNLILRRSNQSSPCLQRAMSESSSNTDFSYYSDADDEYEMSNASNIISNFSLVKTRRFVDLLQTSLPTLKSESVFETDQQILSSSVPNREPKKEHCKKFSQSFTALPNRPQEAIGLSTPKEDYIVQQDRINSTECCFKKGDQTNAESGISSTRCCFKKGDQTNAESGISSTRCCFKKGDQTNAESGISSTRCCFKKWDQVNAESGISSTECCFEKGDHANAEGGISSTRCFKNGDQANVESGISSTECCFKKGDQVNTESGTEGDSSSKIINVERDHEFGSNEKNPIGHYEESNNIVADERVDERNRVKKRTNTEEVHCASKNNDDEDSSNVLENQSSFCGFKTTGLEIPDTSQTYGDFSEGSVFQNIYSSIDRSKLKLEIKQICANLDETALSLQSELQEELTELESEMENAIKRSSSCSGFSPCSSPLTPQSKAAIMLAQIGDEVKDQYEQQLSQAVKTLVYAQLKEMSYVQFKTLAKSIMDHNLPEWRQVALLLVFSQSLVWHSLQCGQRKLGHLIEYTSQLLAEFAADFIIKQGGWGAVMNIDSNQSSDLSTPLSSSSSSGLLRYCHNLNGTKVECPWVPPETSELILNQETNGVSINSENSFALTHMKDNKETSELNVTWSMISASAQQLQSSGKMDIPALKNKTESLGFVTSTEIELGMQTGELEEELFTVNANDGSLSETVRGLTCVTVPNASQGTVHRNTSPMGKKKTDYWLISSLLQNVDLRILALSLGVIAICYGIKVATQQN